MARWPIRVSLFCAGALSLAWSAYCLPILASQTPADNIARRITARESYQSATLADFAAASDVAPETLSTWRHPSALAARATIDLRRLERTMALADTGRIDELFAETEGSIQAALAASPASAFLWSVYFWVENNRRGFRPANLDYLRMSYETGPGEGWVAVARNRFALALFNTLPPGLADAVVDEFRRLVGSRFFDVAIDNLSRQPAPLAARLLQSLAKVELDDRERFAKLAYRQGYDWAVPGVERLEWRPWH